MSRRALIIDAEPEVIDQAVEVVESLGHDFVTACSSREAIRRLSKDNYDYILMGAALPAIRRLGERKPQYAENILDWLHASRNGESPPVIMLCNLVTSSSESTVQVMKLARRFEEKGAAEIIHVPLPTSGMTLDQMIMVELEKSSTSKPATDTKEHSKSKRSKTLENRQTITQPVVPLVLTRVQRDILQTLSECPQETMFITDVAECAGYGRHATRKAIQQLIELGFVHRPHGARKGVALTVEGKTVLVGKNSGKQIVCQSG